MSTFPKPTIQPLRLLSGPQREVAEAVVAADPERIIHAVILRNWSYYAPPSFRRSLDDNMPYLVGDVENHPRLGHAKDVRTTRCRYINETVGIAVTKNTVYILKDKAP